MELAPDEPESHLAMATVHYTLEWDWAAAKQETEAALALDPDYVDAHMALAEWYGVVAGETERGLREAEIARRIDPFSPWVETIDGYVLYVGRRYADAAEAYRRLLEIAPDPMVEFNLALSLVAVGSREDGLAVMDRSFDGVPIPLRGPVVQVYADAGDEERALSVLQEMRAVRDGGGPVGALNLAWGYASVGDVGEALSWLELCFEKEGGTYFLRDPVFDSLRGEPRFQRLWDRVGLPGDPPALPTG